MIEAPVGAAPVLFLTRTSRGESQRESKVSPLTQSQRLIYAPSQFPAAAANQDVVKVAAQLFLFFFCSFCHRPRGRGAAGGRSKPGNCCRMPVFLMLSRHNKVSDGMFQVKATGSQQKTEGFIWNGCSWNSSSLSDNY